MKVLRRSGKVVTTSVPVAVPMPQVVFRQHFTSMFVPEVTIKAGEAIVVTQSIIVRDDGTVHVEDGTYAVLEK